MEGKVSPQIAQQLERFFEREEWTLGDALEQGEVIEDLKQHPGWVLIQRLLGEAHEDVVSRLKHGGVQEQAKYAELTGLLNGTSLAADAAETVLAEARTARERLAETAEPVVEGG